MSVIIDAISESLRKIKLEFEPTPLSFRKDKKQTGDSRELTIQEFITSYIPTNWRVLKGPIYSRDSVSNELDCVVLAPSHPPISTPQRTIIIAEGVYAGIEVKPDISTLTSGGEFHRGLMQIKSAKSLNRKVGNNMVVAISEDEKRIPCVLFSNKSRKGNELISYMLKCVNDGIIQEYELPDIIVTMDNGIILHTLNFRNSIFRTEFSKRYPNLKGNVFIHLEASEKQEWVLALFLLLFYNFNPPQPLVNLPILTDYLLEVGDYNYWLYDISNPRNPVIHGKGK